MEGAGGHAVAQAEAAEPVPELARGLAGEREGQDVAGVGIAGLDAPGDARVSTRVLPDPPGEDAQGPGRGGDGTPLCLVQVVEQAIGGHRGRG